MFNFLAAKNVYLGVSGLKYTLGGFLYFNLLLLDVYCVRQPNYLFSPDSSCQICEKPSKFSDGVNVST